jgi:Rps23 Pro-64 3,4-dihydroxylase Tpa1-like proline 4-hydroxylase
MAINFDSITVSQKPFSHFHIPFAISESLAEATLKWFENDAPWNLTETNFYKQYEFSFMNSEIPSDVTELCDFSTLNKLRVNIENLFEISLSNFVEITAHKLLEGQKICIHNDYIPDQETHRLIIHLNREWKKEWGGLFLLFNNSNPESLSRIIMPASRSAIGFAISPSSHHAVSQVHQGERFTLVYSFCVT